MQCRRQGKESISWRILGRLLYYVEMACCWPYSWIWWSVHVLSVCPAEHKWHLIDSVLQLPCLELHVHVNRLLASVPVRHPYAQWFLPTHLNISLQSNAFMLLTVAKGNNADLELWDGTYSYLIWPRPSQILSRTPIQSNADMQTAIP